MSEVVASSQQTPEFCVAPGGLMQPMPEMARVRRIHFIGIGGSGMCGIAEVLSGQGYEVSGSDMQESLVTKRLVRLGIRVFIGHESSHVDHSDVVVVSAAIGDDNPELLQARDNSIPVVSRAQMLAEIMRSRRAIVVAGTHGKTTTTSLLASVLNRGGLDPTFVVGGRSSVSGTHAQLGKSQYFVAEADESDASFLQLQPTVAVVTNIDADHMDTYAGDFRVLQQAFLDFFHNLPLYGLAVVCIDDPVIRELLPQIRRRVITYGLSCDADYRASDIRQNGARSAFVLERAGKAPTPVSLALAGEHNVVNALGVFAAAAEEKVADENICAALASFEGVDRRFQLHEMNWPGRGRILLVDDYGHHPREVAATVATARQGWPGRRLVMVYQPHRYSRTRDLFDDFVEVLSRVDVLLLVDVYAAGENKIPGADSASLCAAINSHGRIKPVLAACQDEAVQLLGDVLEKDDVLMIQGAGDVTNVVSMLRDHCETNRMRDKHYKFLTPDRREIQRRRVSVLGRVAVLCGGDSPEAAISRDSGQRVFEVLTKLGVEAVLVDIKENLIGQLDSLKPERAFLALHGGAGENGTVQGLLEFLRIPYTGCGVEASALGMDKCRSKLIWTSQNLATPPFYMANAQTDLRSLPLPLPVFVKPNDEGSSICTFPVRTKGELESAVGQVLEHSKAVMIEQMIEGSEFTVGILRNSPLPVIRLDHGHAFFDYDAKYLSNSTRYRIPSGLSAEKEEEVQKLALQAFESLGCCSWGRVDLMQDKQGKFWLLEVNTLPGLTDHSLVPMAAAAVGYAFEDLVLEVLWHTEREEWPWMPVGMSGTIAGTG